MTCPACGTIVATEARYCPACGQNLFARPDERRIATVLFADLVGFTSFSESADPEHVKGLVDTCFEALGTEVRAFGGQVDKIVGDALVALFGAPIAHEDDAERAVRCALQMQRTLADLRDRHEAAAEMRIGVNTGEVLVGAIRAGGDYTAMGDVVNTANRLQTAAQPGQVLVGRSTQAATSHAIRYEELGPLSVKGRDEPVDAWIAVEALARAGQSRRRLRASLVGREAEQALLEGIVDAALAREHAHLVLLTGDAGVGKSRLAIELAQRAERDRGAFVLQGQCVPYGEDVWWPIAETIRQVCDVPIDATHDDARVRVCASVAHAMGRADDDGEVTRVGRGLLYLLGFQDELGDVDPGRARDDALRSARALYSFLAAKQPLVLVLSDVHWADQLVLDLVERLLEWLRGRAFILVATARPELHERWQPGPGRHDLSVLNLEPLNADAVRALVRELVGADATPELIAVLHERSGGNPFFIEELAALIRESGIDAVTQAGRLPATLQGLVAARLDALDPGTRNVLEDCAVVGASGSVEAVAALMRGRGDTSDAGEALHRLAERELLEVRGDEFTFGSEVVRDVAYGTLTKAERARRHARLGENLAERLEGDDSPAALERVAHHYGVAAGLLHEVGNVPGVAVDMPHRALDVLERAANRARGAEVWRSAARLYEQALAVLPGDAPAPTRWRLLLGRGRSLAEQRDLPAAREDAEQVLEEAEGVDDPMTARALTLLADIDQMEGNAAASVETFERALGLWRELGDESGMAEALRGRGITAMFAGDLDGADGYFTDALDAFRSAGDRRGEAWAIQNLATISFFRGDTARADQRLAAAAEIFEELADWGGLNWSLAVLAWVRFMEGRADEAEAIGREQLAESEATGSRWVSGILDMLLASVTLWRGDACEATELARDAVARFRAIGDAWGEGQSTAVLVRALAASGRIEDALGELEQADAGVVQVGAGGLQAVARAQVLAHIGDAGALPAALHLERGGQLQLNMEVVTMIGVALAQAGRIDEAIAELEPVHNAGSDLAAGPSAALQCALALAFAAAHRTDDARALGEAGRDVGTYLDRLRSSTATAFALLQAGDRNAADAFTALVGQADATDAALDRAVARLARAHGLASLGHPDAAAAEEEANVARIALGHDLEGWDRLFGLAARPAS